MTRPQLVVRIDEIRLLGFDARVRSRVGDEVTRELTALFASLSAPLRRRKVQRFDGGSFAAGRSATPRTVGRGIASAVYRAVRKPC